MSSLPRKLDAAHPAWIVPQWNGPARVAAIFTTRDGGASTGAAATMDVGPARPGTGDSAAAIAENRRRLRAFLPSDPVWLQQVHGRGVVHVDAHSSAQLRRTPPQADAAVVRTPGLAIAVRTADCLPVLLADRAGTVVGVAHAGWRGLAAGVLEATVDAMAAAAHEVVVWLGPGIGPRAFEVGADVHTALCTADPGAAVHFEPLREGKWRADLPALARRRLGARGISDVAGGDACTYTEVARFFSYRRDPRCGRMALVAWLEHG
ncbi:MAG: peptidoglycan editing factor PgeF [Burkholderiales bacterium]|nr:peptidoglycan editing factor PgeF [Burkholderiales bacterium]